MQILLGLLAGNVGKETFLEFYLTNSQTVL